MSLDKIQLQAERWLRTAEEDLEAGLPAQRCGTWAGGGSLPAESLSDVARAAQAERVRRSCPQALAQWLQSGVRDARWIGRK